MLPKVCVFCGKSFIPTSPKQNACKNDHYMPCPDCGTPVLVKESYANLMKYAPQGRRCPKCRGKAIGATRKSFSEGKKQAILEKAKKTSRERYGTDYAMQSSRIKEKARKAVKEKYGVDNLSQSSEIQSRIHRNSLDKYGVAHYSQAPEVRKRMTEGMLAKYGVKSPLQSDCIKSKVKQTNLAKYGVENVGCADSVKEKMRSTCQEKYGVDYALQAPEVRAKIRETCKEKYGTYGSPPKAFLVRLQSDEVFRSRYEEFIGDPRLYIETHFNVPVTFYELHKHLELDPTTVKLYCDKFELWDIVTTKYSSMEFEILQFLISLNLDTELIHNDRLAIAPLELDFYFPEYNFAIECNPTYTHNSSIPSYSDEIPLSPSYHKMKTDKANANNIFLFHIFGYEWEHKRGIIQSMLKNILKRNNYRIYARKTEVKPVSSKEAAKFLLENHRQGNAQARIKLGLFFEGELVSLMTFGKTRATAGKLRDDEDVFELIRFCNKRDTTVVGGASKLFKHFINNYHPSKIVSFSDKAHTSGNLYRILGFEQIRVSDPSYVWVNSIDDSYYTRVTCQKRNLRKLFDDESIDISGKTEREIMIEHGYVQVFDAGVIRWEWNNPN